MNTKQTFSLIIVLFVISLAACSPCPEKPFESSGCGSGRMPATGEQTMVSDNTSRTYYLKLPEGYDARTPYPLVMGFHGTGGHYASYLENDYYNLHGAVGEEAILVYPNALLNDNGVAQWNYETDLVFFDDLYREVEAGLCFDTRKVFAVGHSSGGGISHTLGCKKGDVLRAVAPVAGTLLDNRNCVGQVAVIQIHGSRDTMVSPSEARKSRDYWIGINSCTTNAHEGADPDCLAYEGCDTGFPVQYCEHDHEDPAHDYPGHAWPDFAGDAIWSFFRDLPDAAPSGETGTGEVPDIVKGSASFKIRYPAEFAGTPDVLALALYPHGTRQPIYIGPSFIINADVPLGDYRFGEVTAYNNVGIDLSGIEFGNYTLAVVLYVAGGNYPIPTTGEDYTALQDITLDSTTIVVETPFELEFLQSFRISAP